MTRAVQANCALYKMLLLTYPGDFRLRFGSEMVTTFSDLINGEWEHNGLPGVVVQEYQEYLNEMNKRDPRLDDPVQEYLNKLKKRGDFKKIGP